MSVKVSGPNSLLEYEAKKKYISFKEIEEAINSSTLSKEKLLQIKQRAYELMNFYKRIIQSANTTLKMLEKKQNVDYFFKKRNLISKQEREVNKAKSEKYKLAKLIKKLEEKINKM
jgi:hypothetical protein